jgi:hypothetical protein
MKDRCLVWFDLDLEAGWQRIPEWKDTHNRHKLSASPWGYGIFFRVNSKGKKACTGLLGTADTRVNNIHPYSSSSYPGYASLDIDI